MNNSLIIFYDGRCPLCVVEMERLHRYDLDKRLAFEDIHQVDFAQRFPYVNVQNANRLLHGQSGTGELLTGLAVNREAWRLLGSEYIHCWTAWPLIKPLADYCYAFLAQHRYGFSYWLTGESRCESDPSGIGHHS